MRSLGRRVSCRLRLLAPIYRIYEHHPASQVRAYPMPRHIGLILDGNRRYGRQNNLIDPHHIYMAGGNKLDVLLDWCVELAIPAITLWVFSTENLSRSSDEVTGIFSAVQKTLGLLVADRQIDHRPIRGGGVGRSESVAP